MANYILDEGKKPVKVSNVIEWAVWYQAADRVVAQTTIGKQKVSTVFLGIDHRFGGDGPPVLFETMVFGGPHDQFQQRYCTWNQARDGHHSVCDMIANTKAAPKDGL